MWSQAAGHHQGLHIRHLSPARATALQFERPHALGHAVPSIPTHVARIAWRSGVRCRVQACSSAPEIWIPQQDARQQLMRLEALLVSREAGSCPSHAGAPGWSAHRKSHAGPSHHYARRAGRSSPSREGSSARYAQQDAQRVFPQQQQSQRACGENSSKTLLRETRALQKPAEALQPKRHLVAPPAGYENGCPEKQTRGRLIAGLAPVNRALSDRQVLDPHPMEGLGRWHRTFSLSINKGHPSIWASRLHRVRIAVKPPGERIEASTS